MASNAVLKGLENAKPAIARHWATFSELTRDSPALTARVDKALEKYCATISDLSEFGVGIRLYDLGASNARALREAEAPISTIDHG